MLVGLTYDLRDDYLRMGFTEEETAEFDRASTIEGIEKALHALGHQTARIGNVSALVPRLAAGERWDLVFNICEGMYGIGREAQVPAVLDAYRIPYTFSDPLVLSLTLHKAMTKRVVRDLGVPTPEFVVIETFDDILPLTLAGPDADDFPFPLPRPSAQRPLFAKPVAEGTGKGITGRSILRSVPEFVERCKELLERFKQPVLVEEYLPGREFTVGIVGTGAWAESVGVMEVVLNEKAEKGVYSYTNKECCEDLVKYHIPNDAEAQLAVETALTAWRGLGCRDGGRVDIRSDGRGIPNFIEVNPLAGLHPEHSDLPIICNLKGIPYVKLIERIVASAAERIPGTRAQPAGQAGEPAAAAEAVRSAARRAGKAAPLAVVLHNDVPPGAPLDEQDNLVEAEAVAGWLRELGYRVEKAPFTLDLNGAARRLRKLSPRFVFNLVESVQGRGRLIYLATALLDTLGLPYTGGRTDAMFTTSNKVVGKKVLRGAGLAVPAWVDPGQALRGEISHLRFPCIIKSVWEHASVGIDDGSIIDDPAILAGEMARRLDRLGGSCFAEEFIDGREFNLAVIAGKDGPEILPPGEILFQGFEEDRRKLVTYAAKWDEHSFDYHHTPRTFEFPAADAPLLEQMKTIARQCWTLFDLHGYARVDFRVERTTGTPMILEVNVNPCISPDSGFTAMVRRGGYTSAQFVQRVVEECLDGR